MKNSIQPENQIFLSGFMASGKSTLGKVLAEKLGCIFLDLDDVIEEKELKTIRDIFEEKGESYFREKERKYLMELASGFRGVLSLGGGALQDQKVVDTLKEKGVLVFLDTPMQEIVDRVLNSHERPIIFNEDGEIKSKEALFEELKALYSKREQFYTQAHIQLATSTYKSVDEMAKATIEKINRHV